MNLAVAELLHYTDEERAKWAHWFEENGEELLDMPILGDRENTIGKLILHIFGPELRYVQRIRGETLSEYRGRPSSKVEPLFGFGLESRMALRSWVKSAKPEDWSRVEEFTILNRPFRASARKLIMHALIHEIRHWAQIARLVRERGLEPPGHHDLLESEALI